MTEEILRECMIALRASAHDAVVARLRETLEVEAIRLQATLLQIQIECMRTEIMHLQIWLGAERTDATAIH